MSIFSRTKVISMPFLRAKAATAFSAS